MQHIDIKGHDEGRPVVKVKSSFTRRVMRAVGSLVDIQPNTDYHVLVQADKTDLERLGADWVTIGKDIDRAIGKYEQTFIKRRTSKHPSRA